MAGFFKKVGGTLKKVARVVLPVVGAITGIGAITGAAKGVGALSGIGGVLASGKKVIDKVGVAAVNLATGTTQPERQQVKEQKALTKAEVDKWQQVDRLVKAGASRETAMSIVGVTEEEAKAVVVDYTGVVEKKDNKMLIYAGLGLAGLFLLPKLLRGR